MTELKQWYQEKTFFRQDELLFGRCDIMERINLSEILLATSDVAVLDYHLRGLSFDMLKENGFAILVSRTSFKIEKMPKLNDIITVKTWEEAPVGLQLSRRYEILDQQGNVMIHGSSLWIIVDPESRRIIKPNQFTLTELPNTKTDFPGIPCGKIVIPEDMKNLEERIIRYTDLDANGHVNNSRYGAFVMDSLPDEFRKKEVKNFRINYSQESILGDKLQLLGNFQDEEKIIIVGKVEKGTCFEAEITF